MSPTASIQLATELRDTLLQDLVAVGLMMRIAQDGTADGVDGAEVLQRAQSILASDLDHLRGVIDRLGPPL